MPVDRFNFNIGVLGHVDSGKTSLSKALSTVASTACFDKNPQSKERGITLDLGFSSFNVDVPEHLEDQLGKFKDIQYTLVDCPGHASLIRTIIGGAQIIDLMLLVVDIGKGVQTQTAECLIIGEITCDKMIIVLNKVDTVPQEKRAAIIEKMKKRLLKTLESTKFAGSPIVAVAAKPGGPEAEETEAEGLQELIAEIQRCTYLPKRNPDGPFIFAVDHCFSIRGQGTIMTGTALSGSIAVNDTVEIPSMKVQKKIKSMQMFKKPVEKIVQGDRAGLCVTQFDPKQLERGLVCSPGALPTLQAALVAVQRIAYFKAAIATKAKFHITAGHETVMGKVAFFGLMPDAAPAAGQQDAGDGFNFDLEYLYQDELLPESGKAGGAGGGAGGGKDGGGGGEEGRVMPVKQFALVELERPVTCAPGAMLIGSRLDTDIHANTCRLAFRGQILEPLTDPKYQETVLPRVKVYKVKTREGQVERVMDQYTVIGKNLFKKETNIAAFTNLKVTLSTGEQGVIEGGFGQSGKTKIRVPNGLEASTVAMFSGTKKKGRGKGAAAAEETTSSEDQVSGDKQPVKIFLTFKRYVYDPQKSMKQT